MYSVCAVAFGVILSILLSYSTSFWVIPSLCFALHGFPKTIQIWIFEIKIKNFLNYYQRNKTSLIRSSLYLYVFFYFIIFVWTSFFTLCKSNSGVNVETWSYLSYSKLYIHIPYRDLIRYSGSSTVFECIAHCNSM